MYWFALIIIMLMIQFGNAFLIVLAHLIDMAFLKIKDVIKHVHQDGIVIILQGFASNNVLITIMDQELNA